MKTNWSWREWLPIPYGNRTRVFDMKSRCPNHWTKGTKKKFFIYFSVPRIEVAHFLSKRNYMIPFLWPSRKIRWTLVFLRSKADYETPELSFLATQRPPIPILEGMHEVVRRKLIILESTSENEKKKPILLWLVGSTFNIQWQVHCLCK